MSVRTAVFVRAITISGVVTGILCFPKLAYTQSTQDVLADHVTIYGSLRFRGGLNGGGEFEINDKASRIGLRGEVPMGGDFFAFARVEMGLNIVKSPGQLVFSGDPGFSLGEDQDAVTTRLGILGVRTPYGSISWGKQWSPYYDIGGQTDRFYIFGGEAQGTFNLADGDPSGTGRAGSSVQYRVTVGSGAFAAQVQNRSVSDNDQTFADTYGGSVVVESEAGFAAGAAYNKVRDGVANPSPNTREVKDGDEAAILGAWYERGPVALAATVSLFDDHEIDDLGRFFGGVGVELFGQVDVNDHVRLLGGFNHLQPEDVHPGDYRLTYALAGVAYRYPHGVAFFETKVEDSRRSDGVRNRRNIYGIGLRFDF